MWGLLLQSVPAKEFQCRRGAGKSSRANVRGTMFPPTHWSQLHLHLEKPAIWMNKDDHEANAQWILSYFRENYPGKTYKYLRNEVLGVPSLQLPPWQQYSHTGVLVFARFFALFCFVSVPVFVFVFVFALRAELLEARIHSEPQHPDQSLAQSRCSGNV